jgi:flagellin
MSSILTNTSAMVALQTLRGINSNLSKTQDEISTGKSIATARDNSAVWAISKVMESDVKGFKAISDSLSLGQSTVTVARTAAETVSDLLTDIKGKIVAAQESNVDREKIQTDIIALRDQIKSIVNAAQFNGLNLVKGTDDVKVLSSLDRQADGTVVASEITIARQDLSTAAGVYGGGGTSLSANGTVSNATVSASGNIATVAVTYDAAGSYVVNVGGNSVTVAADTDADTTEANIAAAINALGLEGISAAMNGSALEITSTKAFEALAVSVSASGGSAAVTVDDGSGAAASGTIAQRAETITFDGGGNVNEGDSYRITYNGGNYDYIAGKGETFEDVAKGLKAALDGAGLPTVNVRVTQNGSGQWVVNVDNTGADVTDFALTGEDGGIASGGLFGLDNIDVRTTTGADAALGNIETMIDTAIDAAAQFGSAQGRVDTQTSFVQALTDSLKTGIGVMVDADMEEASARLQALQVQQQLAIQSLSIANQQPQSILALFR